MGILDDAKDRLVDAAGKVKDRAQRVGGRAQGAGHSLGERAADAKHWVASRVGGAPQREQRSGGGGDFATEWVDASKDDDLGGPQADGAAGAHSGEDRPTGGAEGERSA